MKTYEPWIRERALELANEGANPTGYYDRTHLHYPLIQAIMKLVEKHETKPVCEDLLLARKIACNLVNDDGYLDGSFDNYNTVQQILKTIKENKNA